MGKIVEKRKRLRVDFQTIAKIKFPDDHIIEALSADISMNGIFIKSDEKPELGTPCEVEIMLKGTSSLLTMNIQGTVARQDDIKRQGLGIKFDNDLEWWSLFSIYTHYGRERKETDKA